MEQHHQRHSDPHLHRNLIGGAARCGGVRHHDESGTTPRGGSRLSELEGTVQAELRTGSARVAVVDVPGHGRLWPASLLLTRPPRGVRLTEFARATSPRTRGDAIYRIAFLLLLFLLPCVAIGSLWGVAYLATFAFAVWLWFGMAPPGWLPGGDDRARDRLAT